MRKKISATIVSNDNFFFLLTSIEWVHPLSAISLPWWSYLTKAVWCGERVLESDNIASNLVQQFTMMLTLSNLLHVAKLQLLCASECNHVNLIKYAVSSAGDSVYQVSGLLSGTQHMFHTAGIIHVKSSPPFMFFNILSIGRITRSFHPSLILPMCIECQAYFQNISI